MDNKFIVMAALAVLFMSFAFKSHAESTLTIDDRAKLGEVYSLEKLRQYAKAIPMIEGLYQGYPDNKEVKWSYVRVLGFGGHWKQATKAFDELCAVKCGEDMFVTYAHILEAQGPHSETLEYIKKLADQHPGQEEIQSVYAEILSWNVKNPEGQQIIEELSTKYPNDLRIQEAYADVLVEQKKYVDAIARMNALLSRNPDDKDLRYQHAQLVSAAGNHEQAVKELKGLLSDGFTKKEAVIMLGDELRLLGRDEEALKVYQEVVDAK